MRRLRPRVKGCSERHTAGFGRAGHEHRPVRSEAAGLSILPSTLDLQLLSQEKSSPAPPESRTQAGHSINLSNEMKTCSLSCLCLERPPAPIRGRQDRNEPPFDRKQKSEAQRQWVRLDKMQLVSAQGQGPCRHSSPPTPRNPHWTLTLQETNCPQAARSRVRASRGPPCALPSLSPGARAPRLPSLSACLSWGQ